MNAKKMLMIIVACVLLFLMIISPDSVSQSVRESITLCLNSVIPSLFPFMIISGFISNNLTGLRIPLLSSLGKLCKIPEGQESLLAIGFLGGYPIGAKNVYNAYRLSILSKDSAERLIAFCSNAGPSFIFGILGSLFTSPLVPWVLWFIHIFTAILVGITLPGRIEESKYQTVSSNANIHSVIGQCIKSIGVICTWIIIFRGLNDIFLVRFQHKIPDLPVTILKGLLELTNGCISLYSIELTEGAKFMIASVFLSFGGICVIMQTASVTGHLRINKYIYGKLLQSTYSLLLSAFLQIVLFDKNQQIHIPTIVTVILSVICCIHFYCIKSKKTVAFSNKMLYNTSKNTQEVLLCCLEKSILNPAPTVYMERD